jgi:hypothetical protein
MQGVCLWKNVYVLFVVIFMVRREMILKIVYLLIFYSFLVRFKFQHTFYSYNAVEIRWIYIFFGVLDGQFLMCYSDYRKSKFLSYLS